MLQRWRSKKSAKYAFAAMLVGLAALGNALLWPLIQPAVAPLFFASVLLSSWLWGLGPGLFATFWATLVIELFTSPEHQSIHLTVDDYIQTADFIFVAVLTSWLTARRKRAEEHWKLASERAEQASRAKDQFLAVLSHELRTPLTPVLMYASAMENDTELPLEQRHTMQMIRQNVELQVRLIDDLLDITRISRGKVQLSLAPVNAEALVRDVVGILGDELAGKQLSISLELDAQRPWVRADSARLQQVFWNLVRNAIKFTAPGGRIIVRSENRADGRLRLTFIDNGIGIEPAVLPHIFDAFEQGGESITRQFGGLGLGLSISKALAIAHGGTLTAASAGKGRGATFTFELPAIEAPLPRAAEPAADAGGHGATGSRKLLLVDDHEDTVRVLSALLSAHGYQVKSATSAAAAIRLAEAEPFDLLLCDIGLPDGSGLDVVRRIRALRPLRAIAISGYGMDADVDRCLAAGFSAHLTKPINFNQLEAAIEETTASVP